MKRRLNERRIGEYKGNLILSVIYTILTLSSIVALFIAPIRYTGSLSFSSFMKNSAVNYLVDNGVLSSYGYFSVSVISLFVFIFISSYLTFSIEKLGKSCYIKITKIIEVLLSFICLVTLANCLYNNGGQYLKEDLIIYFSWQLLFVVFIILGLLSYFKIRKMSIYD